ncbi:N-acetylmuramoyl-L-alanine amidase [Dongia mobilis]|uniref:N-acetylmuramoyl-L-alanine amidase n=1 Tax=Dongia mobilis TaxID=578943 RepID=A0A4R6WR28_9PROT|nr:N-acetylmuramoyl-L-alanine amidase [Dongia mobilis]
MGLNCNNITQYAGNMRKLKAFRSQVSRHARFGFRVARRALERALAPRLVLVPSFVLILATILLLPAAAVAKPAVTDARLGIEAERTRVVLDLTATTGFRVFALGDPHRVVIDLDEVDWQIPAGRALQGRGLVTAMRYGLFKAGTSRVVLDLAAPAEVANVALLAGNAAQPPRLYIDLVAAQDTAFRGQIGRTLFAGGADSVLTAPLLTTVAAAPEPIAIPAGSAAGASVPTAVILPPVVNSTPATAAPVEPVAARLPDAGAPVVSAPATGSLDQAAAILLPLPKPGSGEAAPKTARAKPLIVIDPGHGGIDPGAIGNGTMEKTITLAVANALKKELEATGRFRAMLTRDKDVFLPLRDRFRIARDNGAELFISLHADSHANSKTRGASVYTLSETASDAEAAALAAKENKSDVIAGVDLTHESKVVSGILIDLAQRETINLSARFAKLLVGALKKDTLMLGNSHRFAGFAVLKAPDVPSVLLEMGYISSDEDQQLLTSKKHQKKLAQAITRAITSFFDWHDTVRGS